MIKNMFPVFPQRSRVNLCMRERLKSLPDKDYRRDFYVVPAFPVLFTCYIGLSVFGWCIFIILLIIMEFIFYKAIFLLVHEYILSILLL